MRKRKDPDQDPAWRNFLRRLIPEVTTGAWGRAEGPVFHPPGPELTTRQHARDPMIPLGPPAKFQTYRDPKGLFEFGYPSGWKLDRTHGLRAYSPGGHTFARVDVIEACPVRWVDFEDVLRNAGGTLSQQTFSAGPPKRMMARAEVDGVQFLLDASAHERESRTVILTLANVHRPDAPRKLEVYEERVLRAIRREFKVTSSC